MIYLLSKDFRQSCDGLCDQHLNESIVDACMCVSYYLWIFESSRVAFDAAKFFNNKKKSHTSSEIYRAFYPISSKKDLYDWVVKSPSNYTFLVTYLEYLVQEYRYRHQEIHKVVHILECIPKFKFEQIADSYVIDSRIEACKDLYNEPKSHWKWTNRDSE